MTPEHERLGRANGEASRLATGREVHSGRLDLPNFVTTPSLSTPASSIDLCLGRLLYSAACRMLIYLFKKSPGVRPPVFLLGFGDENRTQTRSAGLDHQPALLG
jgi:hypothetical protein